MKNTVDHPPILVTDMRADEEPLTAESLTVWMNMISGIVPPDPPAKDMSWARRLTMKHEGKDIWFRDCFPHDFEFETWTATGELNAIDVSFGVRNSMSSEGLLLPEEFLNILPPKPKRTPMVRGFNFAQLTLPDWTVEDVRFHIGKDGSASIHLKREVFYA
jgi:hypothetical protein